MTKQNKKFAVVIDTQYDFVKRKGALPVMEGERSAEDIIAPGIEYLAAVNKDEYAGVLFTFDTHNKEDYFGSAESEQFPNIHCEKGTPGWENVFNINLVKGVPVYELEKDVFNMWEKPFVVQSRPLARGMYASDFFTNLIYGPDVFDIELWGVALNVCVKQAVDGFIERGFNVTIVQELCCGIPLGNGPADMDPNVLFAEYIQRGQLIIKHV